MPSTYSSSLRLELQATGENANTWGTKTNNNLNLLQQAIAGYTQITLTSASATYALDITDGAASDGRNAFIKFVGTVASAISITVPDVAKGYWVKNSATGSPLTFRTSSGTGFTLPTNEWVFAIADGASVVNSTPTSLVGYARLSATQVFTGDNTFTSLVNIQSNLSVTGNFLTSGATTLASTVDIKGATSLASTFVVDGAATLNGNVSVSGTFTAKSAASLASTLVVSGGATFNSNVSVSGTFTAKSATSIASTLAVNGVATFLSNISVSGTFTVSGASTLASAVTIKGATSIASTLAVNGGVTVSGVVTLASTTEILGLLNLGRTDVSQEVYIRFRTSGTDPTARISRTTASDPIFPDSLVIRDNKNVILFASAVAVHEGVLKVGQAGTSVAFSSAADPFKPFNLLAIFNGIAPAISPAGGTTLFSQAIAGSSELRVRDEAGNVTTLSPHNFELCGGPSEEMAWGYYSTRNGKAVNVDMMRALRLLEKLSGEKLVFIGDEP